MAKAFEIDVARWIYDGIPYMTRDDEDRYRATPNGREDKEINQKVGLLRLWKVLPRGCLPAATLARDIHSWSQGLLSYTS